MLKKGFIRNRRALSPVISGIILIAVSVTVAMAAATYLGSMSFSFMATEEININNCQWAEDSSFADLTVTNFGTSKVTLESAKINNNDASSVSFISGDANLEAGEMVIMRVYHSFSPNTKYQFSVSTSKSHSFLYISTAPQDSSITFKME